MPNFASEHFKMISIYDFVVLRVVQIVLEVTVCSVRYLLPSICHYYILNNDNNILWKMCFPTSIDCVFKSLVFECVGESLNYYDR